MTDSSAAAATTSAAMSSANNKNGSNQDIQENLSELWKNASEGFFNLYMDRSEHLPTERVGIFLSDCGKKSYSQATDFCRNVSTRISETQKQTSDATNEVCANVNKTATKAKTKAGKLYAGCSQRTMACSDSAYSCTKETSRNVKVAVTEIAEPERRKKHVEYLTTNRKQPLTNQNLATRLLCFPCQCATACTMSCYHLDFDGIMTVLFCCPCRTLCGIFPTSSEKGKAVSTKGDDDESVGNHGHDSGDVLGEPEEIPYRAMLDYELSTDQNEQGDEEGAYDDQQNEEEPVFKDEDAITYDKVFELERKKRQLFKSSSKDKHDEETSKTSPPEENSQSSKDATSEKGEQDQKTVD